MNNIVERLEDLAFKLVRNNPGSVSHELAALGLKETAGRIKELEVENESLRDGWEVLPKLRQELAETKDLLASVADACETAEIDLIALRQRIDDAPVVMQVGNGSLISKEDLQK